MILCAGHDDLSVHFAHVRSHFFRDTSIFEPKVNVWRT